MVFTGTELATLTGANVYFLFRFINEDTRDETFFTGTDVSTNILRYNEFYLTETGTSFVNLTASTVNLPTAFYKYELYCQNSPTNLSLSGVTGNAIELGFALVSGATQAQAVYIYTGTSSTFFEYRPQ